MARHVLVLGGARSGKTSFAERLAVRYGSRPAYLATAEALDSEMAERVQTHQRQRENRFVTIEQPLALAETLRATASHHDVILVDCLTLWISNLLGAGENVAEGVDDVVLALRDMESSMVIFVSNEVGLGIVPDNPMARNFRDLAGSTHQRLAEICSDVYFIAAGLPLTLKGQPPEENGTLG
jgi:adenosylcobinamide kinase/adenosylcobinamide-phosphate guanylyltransferase